MPRNTNLFVALPTKEDLIAELDTAIREKARSTERLIAKGFGEKIHRLTEEYGNPFAEYRLGYLTLTREDLFDLQLPAMTMPIYDSKGTVTTHMTMNGQQIEAAKEVLRKYHHLR